MMKSGKTGPGHGEMVGSFRRSRQALYEERGHRTGAATALAAADAVEYGHQLRGAYGAAGVLGMARVSVPPKVRS